MMLSKSKFKKIVTPNLPAKAGDNGNAKAFSYWARDNWGNLVPVLRGETVALEPSLQAAATEWGKKFEMDDPLDILRASLSAIEEAIAAAAAGSVEASEDSEEGGNNLQEDKAAAHPVVLFLLNEVANHPSVTATGCNKAFQFQAWDALTPFHNVEGIEGAFSNLPGLTAGKKMSKKALNAVLKFINDWVKDNAPEPGPAEVIETNGGDGENGGKGSGPGPGSDASTGTGTTGTADVGNGTSKGGGEDRSQRNDSETAGAGDNDDKGGSTEGNLGEQANNNDVTAFLEPAEVGKLYSTTTVVATLDGIDGEASADVLEGYLGFDNLHPASELAQEIWDNFVIEVKTIGEVEGEAKISFRYARNDRTGRNNSQILVSAIESMLENPFEFLKQVVDKRLVPGQPDTFRFSGIGSVVRNLQGCKEARMWPEMAEALTQLNHYMDEKRDVVRRQQISEQLDRDRTEKEGRFKDAAAKLKAITKPSAESSKPNRFNTAFMVFRGKYGDVVSALVVLCALVAKKQKTSVGKGLPRHWLAKYLLGLVKRKNRETSQIDSLIATSDDEFIKDALDLIETVHGAINPNRAARQLPVNDRLMTLFITIVKTPPVPNWNGDQRLAAAMDEVKQDLHHVVRMPMFNSLRELNIVPDSWKAWM